MSSCLDRHSYQTAKRKRCPRARERDFGVPACSTSKELLHADQRHSHSHTVLFFFLEKKIFADIKTSGSLSFLRRRGSAERFPSIFLTSLHSASDKSGMKIKDSPSASDDDDESSPTRFHLDSRSVCRRNLDRKVHALCYCNLSMVHFFFLKGPACKI